MSTKGKKAESEPTPWGAAPTEPAWSWERAFQPGVEDERSTGEEASTPPDGVVLGANDVFAMPGSVDGHAASPDEDRESRGDVNDASKSLASWLHLHANAEGPASTERWASISLEIAPRHGEASTPTIRGNQVDVTTRSPADAVLPWILEAIRLVDRDTPANRRFFREIFQGCGNPKARLKTLADLVTRGVSIETLRRAWLLKDLWAEELDCGERVYRMGSELYFAPGVPLSWEAALIIVHELRDHHDEADLKDTLSRMHSQWRALWWEYVREVGFGTSEPPRVIFASWLVETLRGRRATRRRTRRRT